MKNYLVRDPLNSENLNFELKLGIDILWSSTKNSENHIENKRVVIVKKIDSYWNGL